VVSRVLVAVVLVLGLPRTTQAGTCDPAEAAHLRTALEGERIKAENWNFAWRVTFTAAAVGSLAGGLIDPVPHWNIRDGLYVGAGKSTIGALARWFMPLRVRVPVQDADACTDLAALRKEARRVAKKERTMFLMGHVGGIVLNAAGAAIIWQRGTLGQALLSVAVGYPVGLLSNYTMPRTTWHLVREQSSVWETAVVGVSTGDQGQWMLSMSGAF
jgi:hypothetical protein